ncbi:AraC-like ligand binding domain-containing protein [Paenibacillus algorifonticola]|uniref:AraC-like ligand binding domain-containing protein n=1 Tax=Paenibacillus algorifonticola TaxID=684063 RepID=A0A1I2HUL9_9BACL|nr:helix-turn-helix domain-containing protein [Paenibacillus algorifonticola]SFF32437.1 AraC-like ligand binding domain-containing protein [Paenibacillus algorifonticola]
MSLLFIPGGGRDNCLEEFALPDFQFSFQLHGTHWRSAGQGWFYPEHEHPLLEINLVVDGFQKMIINDVPYEQSPGDLVIIPPSYTHASETNALEGVTYFCLHLDIDDRSLAYSIFHPPQLFYAADSHMTERLRPILNQLMEASRHSAAMSQLERMKLRTYVLQLLIVLIEHRLEGNDSLEPAAASKDEGRGPSLEIIKLREQNVLESRVQDLFYEQQLPELPLDHSLFPPHRWVGLFTLTCSDREFWTKPDRFWAKSLLEDVLAPHGTSVIIMEASRMTAVLFSTEISVPHLEQLMEEARRGLEQKLAVPMAAGLGGVTADLASMRAMYEQSMRTFQDGLPDSTINRTMNEFVHRIIRNAMSYIQYEYANREFSLSMLANRLDVTPNYLSALFTSETGLSFTRHLTQIRMERAKTLLRETNLKIYQICHNTGYSDQAYFSRLFKSLEGVSPYDYRIRSSST